LLVHAWDFSASGDEFRKALEKLLGDEESRKKLMAELGIDKGEG